LLLGPTTRGYRGQNDEDISRQFWEITGVPTRLYLEVCGNGLFIPVFPFLFPLLLIFIPIPVDFPNRIPVSSLENSRISELVI